jgi:hypothetical protein
MAVLRKLAFSKPHGHVADSMTVAPDFRPCELLTCLGDFTGQRFALSMGRLSYAATVPLPKLRTHSPKEF